MKAANDAPANGGITSLLQSARLGARPEGPVVAELGSLGRNEIAAVEFNTPTR
jgi:hypothetical protein